MACLDPGVLYGHDGVLKPDPPTPVFQFFSVMGSKSDKNNKRHANEGLGIALNPINIIGNKNSHSTPCPFYQARRSPVVKLNSGKSG